MIYVFSNVFVFIYKGVLGVMNNQTVKNRLIKTTAVSKEYSNLTKTSLNMLITIWSETTKSLRFVWLLFLEVIKK